MPIHFPSLTYLSSQHSQLFYFYFGMPLSQDELAGGLVTWLSQQHDSLLERASTIFDLPPDSMLEGLPTCPDSVIRAFKVMSLCRTEPHLPMRMLSNERSGRLSQILGEEHDRAPEAWTTFKIAETVLLVRKNRISEANGGELLSGYAGILASVLQ